MKPGEVFAHGKYTLLRKLRSSGMAEVWLARQHGTEGFAKDVVIKRILPHLAEDEKLVTMFLDEARIAANLNHPNVVQIFDLGNDGHDYFIAMEYIRGYDLEQIQEQLQHRRLAFPPEIGAKIIADTCLGLAYAHDCKTAEGTPMQVVHRDVSPQNVLVSETGVVKLIDFGIAKARTSSTRTQVGHTKGKICYMSPEQMMARELDRRSDIFSAGVVMYELLCGTKPFDGDNLLACFHKLMKEGIVAPRVLRSDLSPQLESIIMTALERDREDRYPTATALRYELQKYLDGEGTMLGPEHLADFLRWLFNPDDSTQIVFDLPRSNKPAHAPRVASPPMPTPATPPPPPASHTAKKFGTEDRLSAPAERVTAGSRPQVQVSQPFVVGAAPLPSFHEPSFGGGPTGPGSHHTIGSAPHLAIGQTGPQLGVGLAFDDDHTPYSPRGGRRKSRRGGGSVLIFLFVFLLLVGGGIGGAYYAGFLGDPGKTPPAPPNIGQSIDGGMGHLPAIPRPPVPDTAPPEKTTPRPPTRQATVVRPPPRAPQARPRVVRVQPRRARPRPRPRPRCRYGSILIDTKTKRARVNISGTGYLDLPLLSPRRMRAGNHRFGFLWPKTPGKSNTGGYQSKRLRIVGCRTTKYFCILDNQQVRCERD